MTLPKPLLVVALEMESQGVLEGLGYDILYTGVGKINATLALSQHLMRSSKPYPVVLNFGSVGSHRFNTGSLVEVSHFIQRDMDVTGLGFELGTTPFDDTPPQLACERLFNDLPAVSCGTGDSFVRSREGVISCDVIDMEGFALARTCRAHGLRFSSLKYVTDGADHDAAKSWESNLLQGAKVSAQKLKDLVFADPSGAPLR